MARDHGRVLCKIWQDKDFRALPRTAQALYVQLISQPNINNAGVLPLMLSKWAKGCSEVTSQSITADLAALVDAEFVIVDTDTEEVLVRSFIRNDGVAKQPNVLKNALGVAQAVESPLLRRVLASELRRLGRSDAARVAAVLDASGALPEGVENPSGRVSEPIQNGTGTLPQSTPETPRSNPSETLPEPIANPGTLPEPFPEPHGEGVGEGEILRSVVGSVGGSRAPASAHARTREETPHPENLIEEPAPADAEPPRHCDRHRDGNPTGEPCRACRDARLDHEMWEGNRRHAVAEARSEAARRAAEGRARAIADCELCDDDGYDGMRLCDHDPATPDRNRRGIEAARAALAERKASGS